MKKIKKFLNDKKGAFSILFVIVAFIGIFIITGMGDVLRQSYVINEVQGDMDVAGISALDASVDKQKLRAEEFSYNKDTLLSTYNQLLDQRIHTGNVITYKKLLRTKVEYRNDTEGLGTNSKPSPQLWLDSTMLVRVKTSQVFDLLPFVQKQFYDSFNRSDFTVSSTGTTSNGETELLIRSVTRVVYR